MTSACLGVCRYQALGILSILSRARSSMKIDVRRGKRRPRCCGKSSRILLLGLFSMCRPCISYSHELAFLFACCL